MAEVPRVSTLLERSLGGDYASTAHPAALSAAAVAAHRRQVLLDKLAERAAGERCAVRLYDALLARHRAELPGIGRAARQVDGTILDSLLEFRQQEAEHFLLACDAIDLLGGDPAVPTPGADVVGLLSHALIQTVCDPRTSLSQSLGAVLAAELADAASWELLARLAAAAGQDQMAREFREAMRHEEHHAQVIRRWQAAVLLEDDAA